MGFFSRFFIPKPFYDGYLPQLAGHEVYFAEFGNVAGIPVLMFHGGPGYHSRAENARIFDLKKYRVIMFDQRGGGKSKPLGKIENNTTQDLLNDAARLLNHLNINEKIVIYGSSWGSTLALLFAERYSEKIKSMLLSKIFLADKVCRDWELEGSGLFYPDILEQIRGELPDNAMIPEYYAGLINSNNKENQAKALSLYGSYEFVLGNLNPCIRGYDADDIDEEWLASSRIYMHYSVQNFMLGDDEILNNINRISNIPALIVHNRLDFVCPPINAYKLHRALPKSKLVFVPERGHGGRLISKINKEEIRRFLENEQ